MRYHALCLKIVASTFLKTLRSKKPQNAPPRAYGRARPPCAKIDTIASNFSTLNSNMDSRPYALPRGELDGELDGD